MATLQRGSSGPEVRALQERLNALGASPPLDVDGEFGRRTEAAVIAFQQAHGLEADGIVGRLTRAALGLPEAAQNFSQLVPIPASINPGVTAARHQTMMNILGAPGALTDDCSDVTNERVKRLLVTANVGPFRVTGLRPAIEALKRIFAQVRNDEPALFASLGTAGMLCCRRVRPVPGGPVSTNFSNHSWGTAIDIEIDGKLDPRGDGQAMLGLVMLHKFFNAERFFWGSGFGGRFEDGMHFEASDELVRDWNTQGMLNP